MGAEQPAWLSSHLSEPCREAHPPRSGLGHQHPASATTQASGLQALRLCSAAAAMATAMATVAVATVVVVVVASL